MTNKPSLVPTLSVVVGGRLLSVVLARLTLSRVAPLTEVAQPGPQQSIR